VTSWQGKRSPLGWAAVVAVLTACGDADGAGAVEQAGARAGAGTAGSGILDAAVDAPAQADGGDAPVDGSGDAPAADAGVSTDLDASAPAEEDPGLPDGALASYEGCVPGVYSGAFNGRLGFLPGLFGALTSVSIEGKIVIHVNVPSAGALLVVDEGSVVGSDADGNPLTAVVSGVLDCAKGTLLSGKLSKGHYVRAGDDIPFTGDVTATYALWPPTLTGTWNTAGGLESGTGVFSAVLTSR
jgi:hypothetical protein